MQRRRARIRRLVALALLLIGAAPLIAQEDEHAAAQAFTKAESMAEQGQYRMAHAAYREIARKWPATAAGQLASLRSGDTAFLGWSFLRESGPSDNRVDVVILGESFTLDQQDSFDDMARRVPDAFASREVLEEYFEHHNFVRVNLISKDGDVDNHGREYDTALDGRMMGRNAPYLQVSRERVLDALTQLPAHDGIAIVLAKAKGLRGTGGAGIAAIGGHDEGTIVHEWGHAFGGLGDEYTTFTHERGTVGQRPNISNHDDPKRVPWAHWIEADAPGIGVYRGGDGRLNGAWRPTTTNCLMHTGREFCPVCREAMVLRIYRYVDPIDGTEPVTSTDGGVGEPIQPGRGGRFTFEVELVQPNSHGLDVAWYVFPAHEAPKTSDRRPADRSERGPLAELEARPAERSRNYRRGKHRFGWTPDREARGRWLILCRVRDSTEVSGSRLPWVLEDERGLLESERSWWVEL